MQKREEIFHYLRDDEKLVALEVAFSHLTVVVMRRYHERVTLSYEMLPYSLFTISDTRAQKEIARRINDVFQLLNIDEITPVHVCLSSFIAITEEKKDSSFSLEIPIKKGFLTPEYTNCYATIAQSLAGRVIHFLSRECRCVVASVSMLPAVLQHGLISAISEDEWYDSNGVLYIGENEMWLCLRAGYYVFALKHFSGGRYVLQKLIAEKLGDTKARTLLAHVSYRDVPAIVEEIMEQFLSAVRLYLQQTVAEKRVVPLKLVLAGELDYPQALAYYIGSYLRVPTMPWGVRGAVHLKYSITGGKEFLHDEPLLLGGVGMFVKDIPLIDKSLLSQHIVTGSLREYLQHFYLSP